MFAEPNISFESNIGYVSRVVFTKLTFGFFRLIHTQSPLSLLASLSARATEVTERRHRGLEVIYAELLTYITSMTQGSSNP
jgi:hypothetical protein